jgi:two-component system sensor histidine kinase CpxA
MRTLFGKIFAWFGLAIVLILATLLFIGWLTEFRPLRGRWLEITGDALRMTAPAAAQIYEQQGVTGLQSFLATIERQTDGRCYLLDSQGRELSGQTPPSIVAEVGRQALNSQQPVVTLRQPFPLGQRVLGPDGQPRYALVMELPSTLFLPVNFGSGNNLLRLGAVILVSLLVCYALARYLSAPVRCLQTTTRRLASGDLTARVGLALGHRRDELADLARDFDNMAERIEMLVIAQNRLLGDISHELRSPLARLNVALELAREASAPQAQESFDRIERESTRLNALIGETLMLARLESSEGNWAKKEMDLAELVRQVAADTDFEARSRQRRVKCRTPAVCLVQGTPELLRRALENVARNGARYTAEETEVLISLEIGADVLLITVRDNGAGVPEEALPQLFRPFYRVGEARARNNGGSGLGLAITERAVHLHGGNVTARNLAPNGLEVEISLPLSMAKFVA